MSAPEATQGRPDFAGRRRRVRERLGEAADALLVTTPVNVRYLTGFTGSNGQLLLGAEAVFLTDGRYEEQSAQQVPDIERRIYGGGTKLGDVLAPLVRELGVARLGVEAVSLTLDAAAQLRAALGGTKLVETTDVVEGLRRNKEAGEVAAIRRAQVVAEEAVREVLARFSRSSESELALELEWAIRTKGAEDVSFDVIVASGAHAALPHAEPRRVACDRDGVLLVDIGARRDGYCSDMTRTYLGPAAPPELARVHAAVLDALEAGCAAVRPGVRGADVDGVCRAVLERAGYGERFVHGTGHGVGLEIHEGPRLAPLSQDILEPGMVVTVEPGVYLPGVGGVRVEDMLVVTEGGATSLTTLDRGFRLPS